MPRRARIMLAGVAVHVVQRGNNKADCFFGAADRDFYLFHLGRMLPRAGCRLHAYCLMTNHVHLLLTPDDAGSCASLMKGIGQLYAQYVNKQYKRSGYLWEGRFKSCLVQSEHYVLACYRYIELNPVRAGVVRHPDEYRWSSFAANAKGADSLALAPHDEYMRLGRMFKRAIAKATGRPVEKGRPGRRTRAGEPQEADPFHPTENVVRP